MSNKKPKTRLYTSQELKVGLVCLVDGNQGHHLVNVTRTKMGDYVNLFNGRAGEWLGEITKIGKGKAKITVREKTNEQTFEQDIWYLFAPIKKARVDYVVQKATELGVSRISPVITSRTNLDRIKRDKMVANCIDAAEQCGRMTIPEVDVMISLDEKLNNWPKDRAIIFCDEVEDVNLIQNLKPTFKKWAILIGPEGGFSPEERKMLKDHKNTTSISLGSRILRADTAAVAALSLWQSYFGCWR
ncbi:MAG: 16S rRNA (uracil(1498)-N(3))-methyltransferase [Kordiimonadaceae bacterium]|jgi:16S rRNA (uracil1498-N3)-methyltransferase|nr:16S rRNA (uracil(1498)-N(3))-methyltransferase [Kordiimonadaceae bacterium]MBT7545310.1 16S rRNA (uracil(1498)-N(3))-methyltransferase [Kordiimonadaceae bacterium]